MAHYPSLNKKRILITGGASGIGEEITKGFVAQGCEVVFIDFDESAGRALASQTGAQFVFADLTQTAAIQTLLATLQTTRGFDVLVNNAARDDRHAIETVDSDQWDAIMAVNIKHYFFVAQAVAPLMQKQGAGAIVNVSSVTAFAGPVDLAVYGAAKGACVSLTRSQARRWGADGIRVNTVVPGWVRTQRQIDKWITPAAEAELMSRQALKRWIAPSDLANMVIFLGSEEARMCTAQTFVVDGGWL